MRGLWNPTGPLGGRLLRRVRSSLIQRRLGATADLENGYAPGAARAAPRSGIDTLASTETRSEL